MVKTKKLKWLKDGAVFMLATSVIVAQMVSPTGVIDVEAASKRVEDYTFKERQEFASERGLQSYMEGDAYLKDSYAKALSFVEMEKVAPLLRLKDMQLVLDEGEAMLDRKNVNATSGQYEIKSYEFVKHSNGESFGGKYIGVTPSGIVDMFCGRRDKNSPMAGTELTDMNELTNVNIKKAMYYGYGGPEALEEKSIDFYMETGNAISEYNKVGTGSEMSEEFRAKVDKLPKAPDNFKAYVFTTNAGNTQPMIYSVYEPIKEGEIKLIKKSSDDAITKNNLSYNLTNAVYHVYATKSDANSKKNPVTSMTTKSNGETNTIKLEVGTYYVREEIPPKGYQLDEKVYEVVVAADKTITLNVVDIPAYGYADELLYKVDELSMEPKAMGDASLMGAEFTVKYYDTYDEIDEREPLREWIFVTDEDGIARYQEDYEISNNPLYQSQGKLVLPLGTYTIQETKAPTGYMINPKIFTSVIKSQGDVLTAHEVDETIIKGGVSIEKRDLDTGELKAQGDATFDGVEFTIHNKSDQPIMIESEWFQPGEAITTIVVKDGVACTEVDYLPYGTYGVEETKVPVGYYGSDEMKIFEVRDSEVVKLHDDEAFYNKIVEKEVETEEDFDIDEIEENSGKGEMPETSDGSNLVLLLRILSISGMAMIYVYERKKCNQ